jgi:hypothetical protein
MIIIDFMSVLFGMVLTPDDVQIVALLARYKLSWVIGMGAAVARGFPKLVLCVSTGHFDYASLA